MTRTVFDNAMTAHVWASQSQDNGQSHNGNLFFQGRTLYSYGSHYVVGYAAPGGLFLLNADSSSMTTNGKHKPAAWRAVRGLNSVSVPGLTETSRELGRCQSLGLNAAESVRRIAKHLESGAGGYWPGAEAATAIFRALGASDKEAQRRGRAGESRVSAARDKAREAEAKRELDSNAREAKRIAAREPAETGRETRDLLADAADASQYREERLIAEATELGREAFRAAKAAKAKGWPRIAAACRAHHKAARAELARYENEKARYATRAHTRNRIQSIRGAAEQVKAFWNLNPLAHAGAVIPPGEEANAVRQCETGAKGFGQLAAALGALGGSAYAGAVWGPQSHEACQASFRIASSMRDTLAERAGALRLEWQREARDAWRANGTRPPYELGQLSDSEGGALIRASGVERDDSGAITGGQLVTSWGANVPLVHAIRAFRFLKYCHDTGQSDSSFDGWNANGKTIRVGHFRIDHVDRNGNLKAGCHRINWAECQRLAAELGLSNLAPSVEALEPSRAVA